MRNYNAKAMIRSAIAVIIMILVPALRSSGQNQRLDNLDSYKIGFFTKRLNLTSAEAERFWPVYNEYQKQKTQIQLEKVSLIRDFNQNESSYNDNQMAEIGDKLVAYIVKESELAVTFHMKLKEVFPPAKVIRFYQAENQYKTMLLNELQENRQQQRPKQPRDL